jgi:DNA-binding PadR family transcriptional regulator
MTTRRPSLSLNEWAVLGLLVDASRHGYEIAAELRPGTPIGEVWRVNRQLVYRAIDRLAALGMAEPRRQEPGEAGPPRTVFGATERGRSAVERWLATPVQHLRDVRGALLLKLALAHLLGTDTSPLVEAQRAEFSGHLAALAEPPDSGDVVPLWRHHSALAVSAFLAALAEGAERAGDAKRADPAGGTNVTPSS